MRNSFGDSFRRDSSLDEAALRKLVRRQVEAGIDFLVPCGTTGENPTLSREEHLRVVEITLEEAARPGSRAGGCRRLQHSRDRRAGEGTRALHVDGILSVTPYYNKPTPEGLYQHYKAIAGAVSLPDRSI